MATASQNRVLAWSKSHRRLVSVAIVCGGIGIAYWIKVKSTPAPKPQAPLIQSVTALGRLTPEGGLVTLSVPAGTSGGNEVVTQWLASEGEAIKKGQLLARLSSNGELVASLKQAEANLQSTQALLPFLKISKSRGQELYGDGAISEEELGKTSASIISRRADISAGTAAVQRAQQQLLSSEVRSPLDGYLIRIYSWPGMKEGGDGLAIIGRTDRMQVWAQVFQTDVSRLVIGQRATITAESGGFKGKLQARLNSIIGIVSERDLFSIAGNNDVNARVVLVKLNLEPADISQVTRLSGLNVTVRFDPL